MKDKHRKVIALLKKWYPDATDLSAVDVGGGPGWIIDNIGFGFRMVLDINSNRFVDNKSHLNMVADVCKHLPFDDEYFDVCIFSEVLEHVMYPQKAIAEVCRISKDVVMTTPNNILIRRLLRWLLGRPPVIADDHLCEYSYRQVRRWFGEQGFVPIDFLAYGFFISQIPLSCFPRWSAKMIFRFRRKE